MGILEETARYAGLLLAPALIMLLWPILAHFWCPVVTLVTFNINSEIIQKIPLPPKKTKKIKKKPPQKNKIKKPPQQYI